MTTLTYEAPGFVDEQVDTVNGAVPFVLAAMAGAVSVATGASVAHVVWVCAQCPEGCRSFNQTVETVKNWWGAGC